ncbi:hypothetical protein [Pectinatus frisingensis]|uniref:hypothetical protein n=1 Tax=Pectinatus frisingensis TaxID=865 RepID=UPI003D803E7E
MAKRVITSDTIIETTAGTTTSHITLKFSSSSLPKPYTIDSRIKSFNLNFMFTPFMLTFSLCRRLALDN